MLHITLNVKDENTEQIIYINVNFIQEEIIIIDQLRRMIKEKNKLCSLR